MKKLTTSILLALFSATILTPTHVEASWLSKTWKKIEMNREHITHQQKQVVHLRVQFIYQERQIIQAVIHQVKKLDIY